MIASMWSDVYGMNRRNRDLISSLNPRKAIKLANDKAASKEAFMRLGIATPELIAVVRGRGEVPGLLGLLRARGTGFVVKPSFGAGGRGVTIFNRATSASILPAHESPWSEDEFIYYICRILAGEFTVGMPVDAALVERRIEPDKEWIVPQLPGPPDLRVIVAHGRAILAMTRLPTLQSKGRANLHQGGVGLGIDLDTGLTSHAIWKGEPIEVHPDSGVPLIGRPVESLGLCVKLAEGCADAVPLGYMGVDIMRDKDDGPCVIEVNARPGLAIQLANRIGIGAAMRRAFGDGAGEI